MMKRSCEAGLRVPQHRGAEDNRPKLVNFCKLHTVPQWCPPYSIEYEMIGDSCPICEQESRRLATPDHQGHRNHKTCVLPDAGKVHRRLHDRGEACSGGTGHGGSMLAIEPEVRPCTRKYPGMPQLF